MTWPEGEVRPLPLEEIDERLHRYRLAQPKLEKSMAQSLARYGQISPIVICMLEAAYVLIDGFKRLRAARTLQGPRQGQRAFWVRWASAARPFMRESFV